MILTLVFGCLVAASLLSKRYEGLAFAAPVLLHDFTLGHTTGFAYYGSAALTDALVVALLAAGPASKLALRLSEIGVASVAGNLAGYAIWYAYLPPMIYNYFYVFLYAYGVLLISTDDGGRGDFLGGCTVHRVRPFYRRFASTRNSVVLTAEGQDK